jgi:hypothetical protein
VTRGRLEELYEGRSDLSVEEARSVFESVGLPLFEGALALKREDSRLILPDFVTPQICRLWGFLAADGWLTDGQLYFARGLDEIQNKKYEDMLEAFGLPVGFQNGKEEAYVSSVAFVSLFRELGWTDGAHDKRVPGWIFGLAREYREEFLEGFADGDGHRRAGSTSCTIQLCNRLLVEDLKTLVDGLGWTCGLVHTYQSKESVIKAGTPRALWPGKFVEKDLVIKGGPQYSICWSKNSLACDRGWSSEPILSISKDGEDETFDLEVADASHSFVTNGVCGENSVLEPARWIWKRLMLLEDAALVYRLQRAPERYAFYVDTGDLPPPEALAYVNRVRQNFKKTKYVNPSTGKVDLKFNPLSQDEDFFIPVRKGAESNRVEVLGAPSWQHMEDIEYFRDKLFAALKIPKSYLGQEEGVNRATLGSQDVRFARTVLRIQRELRNGMGKVTRVHLAALNVDPKSVEYDIHMTVPSAIFELAQLEVRNARADLAGRMREFVSLRWMLNKIFGMSDSEIEEIIKERGDDVVREAEEQAKAQQAVNPPEAEAPPEGDDQETPPEGEGEPKESVTSPLIENFSRQKRFYSKTRRARGISEQELLVGDRGSERRAEDKLNKLLESDKKLAHRLDEVSSLLGELRAVAARK